MTDKNPYENGVDIPEFVEKNDNDIDMSVFKMAENEVNNSSFDIEDDEEEYDDEPKRKLSSKGIIIIGGALIVLLLIGTVSGWIFGISKNNSLKALQAEYDTIKVKLDEANTTVTTLNNENIDLKAKITELETKNTSSSTEEGEEVSGDKYKFDGDINVRDAVGSKTFANFDKLPDRVADQVYYDSANKTLVTREDAVITVIETKADSSGNTWGKVADNAWICIKHKNEKTGEIDEWAKKQ